MLWLLKAAGNPTIDVTAPETISGVQAMVTAGRHHFGRRNHVADALIEVSNMLTLLVGMIFAVYTSVSPICIIALLRGMKK